MDAWINPYMCASSYWSFAWPPLRYLGLHYEKMVQNFPVASSRAEDISPS